jgi:hypothetical protein
MLTSAERLLAAGTGLLRTLLNVIPWVALVGIGVAVGLAEPRGTRALFLVIVPVLASGLYGVRGTVVMAAVTTVVFLGLTTGLVSQGILLYLARVAGMLLAAVLSVWLRAARFRSRQLSESRDVALALQEGLLPGHLLSTSAVESSSRYLPADSRAGVGGDWFDVIQLSGTRVALILGDVVGHGVHAAAMMGRLRAAVRTLAELDMAPDELLARLDDLVCELAEDSADRVVGASCLVAVYDPITRRLTVARAGHPAPVVVRPSGGAEFLPLPDGPPLGLGGEPFEERNFTLPEGSLIVLFSDGLLGLRQHSSEEAMEQLKRAVAESNQPLEALCDAVLAAVPADREDDDVALLVARTHVVGPERVATWELPPEERCVSRARRLAAEQLQTWGLDAAAFSTELIVSELVTNAVRHASGTVGLRLIYDRRLICEISDGSSTSPHLRHARLMDEGGRGLFLVGRFAERWGTRYTQHGKTIWAEQPLEGAAPEFELMDVGDLEEL